MSTLNVQQPLPYSKVGFEGQLLHSRTVQELQDSGETPTEVGGGA